MKFTIFHKTGELRDGYNEWDGDEGYETEEDIDDEEVHRDIVLKLYDTYIRPSLPEKTPSVPMLESLKQMFDDMDCWDNLEKEFYDELKVDYEERSSY